MSNSKKTLLEVKEIALSYGNKTVLKNINLSIKEKSVTTIVGPNGAGKSSLLKVILKLIKADSGKVIYSPSLTIGYVPQKIHLDNNLPLTCQQFLKLKRGVKRGDLENIVNLLSIDHLMQSSMHRLSGGELQRVLFARALLNKPKLLVLDEPVQGVDINGQVELYNLINSSKQMFDCAVLMVSHDLHLVMANTDHVICINQHICCQGSADSVANDPDFISHFGTQYADNFALYTHHHDHHHHLDGDICHCGETQHFSDNSVKKSKDNSNA